MDTLRPIQPFLKRSVKNYEQLAVKHGDISFCYAFTMDCSMEHKCNSVPDACVDILFSAGEHGAHTTIGGTVFQAKDWNIGDDNQYFGVRFFPGRGVLPNGLTMEMVVDQDLVVDGNIFGESLPEQIMEAKSLEEKTKIFQKAYDELVDKHMTDAGKENIVNYMRKRIIENRGALLIGDLSEETNYSEAYLRRVFKEYEGISPKQFAKYIRFQNLLQEMKNSDNRLDELALACGYYDEAQMMHEFKNYVGLTVQQYTKMK